jgi:hypothetical protein
MQKRAGLLYLARSTNRILLLLENNKWTVPTFERKETLLVDAIPIFNEFSVGKVIPVELYRSNDSNFEFETYICVSDNEFLLNNDNTFAWCNLNKIPHNIHRGLKITLDNPIIKNKLTTILNSNNLLILK